MKNIHYLLLITLCYSLLFYHSLFSFSVVSIVGAGLKITLSTLTVYLLMSVIRNKKINHITALYISVNFALLFYIALLFGRFTSGMFASVLESNAQESFEYLLNIDPMLLAQTLLLSGVLHYALINIAPVKNLKPVVATLLLCVTVVAGTQAKSKGLSGTQVTDNVYRADGEELLIFTFSANANSLILASLYEYLSLSALASHDQPSQWRNIKQESPAKDIYVVVIGESAIKDKFALYGYNRATSDTLEQTQNLTLVQDPIAPSTVTRTSLPRIFYVNDVNTINYGLNIIDLAKGAGLTTYWISNQGVSGNHDTPITSIAKRADKHKFLNSNYELAKNDDVLLDELALIVSKPEPKPEPKPKPTPEPKPVIAQPVPPTIASKPQAKHKKAGNSKAGHNKVVFLHTMGSHTDFCDRIIGAKYSLPAAKIDDKLTTKQGEAEECYDNSILNTYKLLTEIKTTLDQTALSYKIIYFSDHGLVKIKYSPYYSHGSGKLFSKKALEVPLIFISQQPVTHNSINSRYYLSDFPHTFADWIGVSADQIDYRRSVLSPLFTPALQRHKVLDDAFNVRNIE
jgi:glucan phosphoethanolaminetransferase (alkaline phosphatase superfamily)